MDHIDNIDLVEWFHDQVALDCFQVHAHDPRIVLRDEVHGEKMKHWFLAWLVINN
jgi:hypothetical protein